MGTHMRPADGAMTLAEMKEFASFPAATQRYIRRSLDVGLGREDALARWSRDVIESASIMAQARIYNRLDHIRDLVPDDSGLDAIEPFLAPLITVSAFDLGQDRLSTFGAYRFLYERLIGANVRPWLPGAFCAAAALPHLHPEKRRLLLQSTRKIAEQLFRLPHIIQFPGLAERSPDRGVQVFRQSLQDVAALVDLAALDRCVRETADFETPSPLPVGMSPSGRRTAQAKRRVETLIGIRFIAQRASRSSDWATSHLGTSISRPPRPRTRGRSSETLPPWKPILPWVLPQRWPGLPSR